MLAIYCRTSKNKEEGTDFSIESQQQGGVTLANKMGWEYKYYIDEGISGTLDIDVRPSFAEMMSAIKKEDIQAVYCIDQSRIERNTNTWRFFVGECINHKCKYYPNGKELDLTDPDSMLFANLLSLVNSYYSQITSKKVKIANHNKAQIGKTHGIKPYGFKRDENNNYIIVDAEAKIVRRIYNLSLEGTGTYTIANLLNEEGIPTKFHQFKGVITRKDKYTRKENSFKKSNVKWRGTVVYDILRNPIYKGIRIWSKNNEEHRVEIDLGQFIVNPKIWDEVNENLSKNKKNVGKRAKYNYLLNGLTYCGHCQSEVIGKKRLAGRDNAYKCKGKRPPYLNCSESRGISLPKLENFIIHHLFYNKELKKLLVEAPKNITEVHQLRQKLEMNLKDEIRLQNSNQRLAKLLKDPELSDDEDFLKDYKEGKSKLKHLRESVEVLKMRLAEVENEYRNQNSKTIIESYTSDIAFKDLKKLVHSLIEKIEISHEKEAKFGHYFIKINYKGYDEVSLFMTSWQALEWYWLLNYTAQAMNEEELKDDISLIEYLVEKSGKGYGSLEEFKGFEKTSVMHDCIKLKKNELILFD